MKERDSAPERRTLGSSWMIAPALYAFASSGGKGLLNGNPPT
jgi:hypothetical protein